MYMVSYSFFACFSDVKLSCSEYSDSHDFLQCDQHHRGATSPDTLIMKRTLSMRRFLDRVTR